MATPQRSLARLILLLVALAAIVAIFAPNVAADEGAPQHGGDDVFGDLETEHAETLVTESQDSETFEAKSFETEKEPPVVPARKKTLATFLLSPFRSLLNGIEKALFGLADEVYDDIVEFITFPFVWIYDHTIGHVRQEIKEAIDTVIAVITWPFRTLKNGIKLIFTTIHNIITWPFRTFWHIITAPFRFIQQLFISIWESIKHVLEAPFILLYKIFVAPFIALLGLIVAPFIAIRHFIEEAIETVGHIIMPIWFTVVVGFLGYIYLKVAYPLNVILIAGLFGLAGFLLWTAESFEPGQH